MGLLGHWCESSCRKRSGEGFLNTVPLDCIVKKKPCLYDDSLNDIATLQWQPKTSNGSHFRFVLDSLATPITPELEACTVRCCVGDLFAALKSTPSPVAATFCFGRSPCRKSAISSETERGFEDLMDGCGMLRWVSWVGDGGSFQFEVIHRKGWKLGILSHQFAFRCAVFAGQRFGHKKLNLSRTPFTEARGRISWFFLRMLAFTNADRSRGSTSFWLRWCLLYKLIVLGFPVPQQGQHTHTQTHKNAHRRPF